MNEACPAPNRNAQLDDLLAATQPLETAYVLKDQLKATFDYRHVGWARRALITGALSPMSVT